jgi:uncharacterized membrane protein
MSSKTRRTAVLVLLAVFLVGGAAGWVLEEVVEDMDWPAFLADRHGQSPDRSGDPTDDDAEEDFLETLGLSREQMMEVDRLLDAREDRLEEYWRTRLPEIEAVVDSTRAGIRSLLTTDQRAAYDRWVVQQRQRAFNR